MLDRAGGPSRHEPCEMVGPAIAPRGTSGDFRADGMPARSLGGPAVMSRRLAVPELRRACWLFTLVAIATPLVPGCGESPAVDPAIKVEQGKNREESTRPGAQKKAGAADPRFGKGPD